MRPVPYGWDTVTALTCSHSAWVGSKEAPSEPTSNPYQSQALCDDVHTLPVQLPKDAYISHMRAIRIGAVPFLPPASAGQTGFSRPLELARSTLLSLLLILAYMHAIHILR